jgi:glycosyltransferase involved in cell wall biosynthesis
LKKRICIDIRICQKSSRFTGVGIYAYHISKFIEENNSEFEFWYLVLKGKELPWKLPLDRLISLKRPNKPESIQEVFDFFDLKYLLKKNKISIFHSLVPGMLSPAKSLSVVTTIHDIIPDILPLENYTSPFARFLYRLKMKISLKSSYIITDSIATKKDFTRVYNFKKQNISTVYLSSQFSNDHVLSIQKSKEIVWDRKYLLYTGGFNYRKNVPMVIKSFASIADDFPEVDLLLVGKPSNAQLYELNNIVESFSHLKGRIILKGFISDTDLPKYYSNCEAFIYPSFYEGFGIPVLEAMQCCAPVITSDRGSIPEVVGLSGIMVNPESISEISEAIFKVLKDPNLQTLLRNKGLQQARIFSWETCAIETIKVYRNILKIS